MPNEPGAFNRPRIVGGLLLIGASVFLVSIDAFSRDYAADFGTLALFLGTSAVLLGVEGIRRYMDGPS